MFIVSFIRKDGLAILVRQRRCLCFGNRSLGMFDDCHEKTDLKVFVLVIPTPTTKYYSTAFIDYTMYSVVNVIPKEGLAGPARQSFFGYDNDKDLKVCFLVTCIV